ncbi:hypothetical protein Nepgr_016234 [Nepenthes gracilis]|uniref:Uncharacterized protein n=1 Tax=Nepenthes gracilis TaxID=150966 RepID=A0AAD3SN71_NEPGR|nr:hypothetical protein Nepgr_016234 [Nepenthes gracilis]
MPSRWPLLNQDVAAMAASLHRQFLKNTAARHLKFPPTKSTGVISTGTISTAGSTDDFAVFVTFLPFYSDIL